MQLAMVAAGFTPGEADQLRRAMAAWKRQGGLEQFEQQADRRHARATATAREFAERIFQQILGFGEYGFPESHAASFALLVYVSSWLKRHHPAAFCAALLNSQPMGFYAPAQLVQDARRHGVEVRAAGRATRATGTARSEEGALRLGLRMVSGLAEAAGKRIAAAPAASVALRDARSSTARICAALAAAGALQLARRPPPPRALGRRRRRRAARRSMPPAARAAARAAQRRAKARTSSPTTRASASRWGAIRSRCCASDLERSAAARARGACSRLPHGSARPRRRARHLPPAARHRERRDLRHAGGRDRLRQRRRLASTWSSASGASCSARACSACRARSSATARSCTWSPGALWTTARCSARSTAPSRDFH